MSSYHSSFTYLKSNSSAEGFAIGSFDADNGFTDTYLGMDQIYTDSYDQTHRHLYGTKYNSVATITITIVKIDGSDVSVAENRRILRWLTGSRKASWLDLYAGDNLQYSFYCTTQNVEQYKLDSRVVGFKITFESVHPWAWSAPQSFVLNVDSEAIQIDESGAIYKEDQYGNSLFWADNDGCLHNDKDLDRMFNFSSSGLVYDGETVFKIIDNKSDDLYTYTNLDITFKNKPITERYSTTFTINNLTLNEQTTVSNISPSEIIQLSASQFIVSDNKKRIFGDDFSWQFPRLAPGENELLITTDGKGEINFTYRYPIKIGDCALDIESIINNPWCEGEISGAVGSVDGITKVGRKNIIMIDRTNGMSYTIAMYDSKLTITETTSTRNQYSFAFEDVGDNVVNEINLVNNRLYITTDMNENFADTIHDYIILVDNVTNTPYKLMVDNNSLYFIEV